MSVSNGSRVFSRSSHHLLMQCFKICLQFVVKTLYSTFETIFRGCHRQPLYYFHFDFRNVTLDIYVLVTTRSPHRIAFTARDPRASAVNKAIRYGGHVVSSLSPNSHLENVQYALIPILCFFPSFR